MKVNMSTYYGKQNKCDVIINDITAYEVHASEEAIALEKGFALDLDSSKESWYFSRNTRINLDFCEYNPMPEYTYEITATMPESYYEIYQKYLDKKGFKDLYKVDEHPRFKYFVYKHVNEIVAVSVLLQYVDAIESHLFIWDYETPSLKIGINSLFNEMAWAKDNGYHYLYTGSGYEKSSIYKADFKGFEWFTGMEWSRDAKLFKELCTRDSAVNTLEGISNMTRNDDNVDQL